MSSLDFDVLDKPSTVTRFDPALKWSRDLVDYKAHPAYAAFVGSAGVGLRAKAALQFVRGMLPLMVKRITRYSMIPVETRKPRSVGECLKLAGTAGRNALGLHSGERLARPRTEVFETLDRDGVCVVQVREDLFAEIEMLARPHFARLEDRRAKTAGDDRAFEESRSNVDAREHGQQLYDAINDILEKSGILDATSQYLGRDARLIDVNPQINDPSDSFWRSIFPDMKGMKLPDSAYFHRDASGGDLKAIFYMTDVGPENGPFSYVVGSNRLNMSRVDDMIAEANDHNGLSGTGPDARRRFAALPGKLRQKGSFGNDLPDDSRLAGEIRKGTWQITAGKGSIVLFDTKGVHRGGMVEKGERYVITTVLG
ncbi:hypothetical protein DKT77_00855 [Meridianimarinicoccus roseus]|uniref:Phytanoyl-CoA dioxygenase n=1 Tax=Meridianimarinicoccus roseus TaxID=2072018 RepID=A0A2V2LQQ4_9RHOB|nr:phytanoyl-CoA dioxygenase family protein [Meridianimarinicoccus roseus]PWR04549.1 hypothetical protein DKT77_00855 [Meridianimarinicoccus roseus]